METNIVDSSLDLSFPHPRHQPTRAEVLSCKTRIHVLEKCIEDLQNDNNQPKDRLCALQLRRRNYVSYISPLRCLPEEIIRKIVYLCLHKYVQLVTVMHICGTFRDNVINMSTLWSRIEVKRKDRYEYTDLVRGALIKVVYGRIIYRDALVARTKRCLL
jgi:hypothetical protein